MGEDAKDWGELSGFIGTRRGLPDDFGTFGAGVPERRESPTHLKLNLLENGIDFIRSGIENHFLRDDNDASAHKYALLHMFAGVQLILKERLRRERHSLIFSKVEEAGEEDRPTIGLDASLARLKSCAGIALDPKDVRLLGTVRRMRNRLEHYECEINLKQTQYLVGSLCEFTYFFLRDHLATDLGEHLPFEVRERVEALRRIAERLEAERIADWKARAEKCREMTDADLAALLESTAYHPKDNPVPRSVYWSKKRSWV